MSKSCGHCHRLEAALRAARSRLIEIGQYDFASPKTIKAIDGVLTGVPDATIFECRTCDRTVHGWTDGRFAEAGWGRIDNIDGPNAICPHCQEDDTVLDGLREDYPNAAVTKAA